VGGGVGRHPAVIHVRKRFRGVLLHRSPEQTPNTRSAIMNPQRSGQLKQFKQHQ
jgi:hypothetical protein